MTQLREINICTLWLCLQIINSTQHLQEDSQAIQRSRELDSGSGNRLPAVSYEMPTAVCELPSAPAARTH